MKPVITEYVPGAIGRIVALHADYYSKHWKFGLYFEAKVAAELSELLTRVDAMRCGFWVALLNDAVVGGVAIDGGHGHSSEARLRFLIVAPEHQGKGIGSALMDTAMHFCREKQFSVVYLNTFDGLDAARRLYEKHGFSLTEEKEDTTWGVTVKEQRFECEL